MYSVNSWRRGVCFVKCAMTQGAQWKHILLFALPIMAGNLLQQLYNIADSVIVGNFVGQTALSAVGTCAPMTILFIAFALGMSNGSAVIVAQYFGAGRRDELRQAVSTALILLICLGLGISVIAIGFARPLLAVIMGVPEPALSLAVVYYRVYSVGLVFQFAYNITAAILRAIGDSKATLYFLLVSAITNVLLDLLFVGVFEWGVAGAAVATVIAQALSAVVSVVYMFRRHEMLRFRRAEFRFHKDMGLLALKLGVPTSLQQCVVSFGHIAIQRVINSFGEGLMAASTVEIRLQQLIAVPAIAFQAGMSTFTGQNIGAEKPERIPGGYHATLGMSAGICLVLSVLAWVFAEPLVVMFGVEPAHQALAVEYVRFAAYCYVLFPLYQTTAGLLSGAGDVLVIALLTLGSLGVRTVATYIMAYLTPIGHAAAWISMPISWGLALLISVLRYRFGSWKQKSVIKVKTGVKSGANN